MLESVQKVAAKQEECCENPEILEPQDFSNEGGDGTINKIQLKPEEAYVKCEKETQRNLVGVSMDSINSENGLDEPPSSVVRDGFSVFPCKFCGKLFSSSDILKIHINIIKEAHVLQ